MVCLLIYAPKCSSVVKAPTDDNIVPLSLAGALRSLVKNANCYFKGLVSEHIEGEIIPGIVSKESICWIEFVSLVAIFVSGILLLFNLFNFIETFPSIPWNRFEMCFSFCWAFLYLTCFIYLIVRGSTSKLPKEYLTEKDEDGLKKLSKGYYPEYYILKDLQKLKEDFYPPLAWTSLDYFLIYFTASLSLCGSLIFVFDGYLKFRIHYK